MAAELDKLEATLVDRARLVERLGGLREGLVACVGAGLRGADRFDLAAIVLAVDGDVDADRVDLLRLLVLDDPSVRCAASAALAAALYHCGVPRDVSDHRAPGPWAAFGILVAHADQRVAGAWAASIQPCAERAPGVADAALLGLAMSESALDVLEKLVERGATTGFAALVRGGRALRMLRDAPASAPALPDEMVVPFHQAAFLRGLRRRAARHAGASLNPEQREVVLPAWLHWDRPDAPPPGLIAALAEWLSAARRSKLADLRVLEAAAELVEQVGGRSDDHRLGDWVKRETDELRST